MSKLIPSLLLISLSVTTACLAQQDSLHTKLVKTQGTEQSRNVHCSLLDKKGNLWFGTTGEGIYKYDGKYFTQFTVDNGLCNNYIYSMLQDKYENIWMGTENGITIFDGQQFICVPDLSSTITIWTMMEDQHGTIWLGTDEGVLCYDGKSFTRFLDRKDIVNTEGLSLQSIESILEDNTGRIWFGTYFGEGISYFDGQFLQTLVPNVTLRSFGYVRVMSMLQDCHGTIWFGTGDGAYTYDGINLVNLAKEEGIDWVYSIVEDSKDNIWLATENASGKTDEDGGVWRYDGTTFTHFRKQDGLIHNGVFSITEDSSGNLWFGTRNMGLSRFDGTSFTTFSE